MISVSQAGLIKRLLVGDSVEKLFFQRPKNNLSHLGALCFKGRRGVPFCLIVRCGTPDSPIRGKSFVISYAMTFGRILAFQ